MVSTTRRTVLAGVSAALLSGCVSSGESSGDSGGSSRTETMIDQTQTIPEDEYIGWDFSLNSDATLELDIMVRDGPNVDAWIQTQDEKDEFERGNNFRYNSDLSSMDTVGFTASGVAPEGDYSLIIDNTTAGEAAPPTNMNDDYSRVEITLKVSDA